nr:hypothetical protein [Caldicellulosiruptor hydrothermalis]
MDNLSLNEERNFSVKVEYFDGENLKAKLIDEKTKEEYNIGDSDTVTAQFAIAIPIALGLAEALIASLLLIGKVIELFGEKYVEASEVIENVKNNKYEYYKAAIKNGILYIGPTIDYPTAFTRVYNFDLDVFCKNKSLAYTLAQNVANSFPFSGFVRGPDKDGYSSIYFYHYHVYKYITSSFVYKLPCHIFFP